MTAGYADASYTVASSSSRVLDQKVDFAAKLKEHTKEIHDLVAKVPCMVELFRKSLPRERYLQLLGCYYHMYTALERSLEHDSLANEILEPIMFLPLFRSKSVQADLEFFLGEGWESSSVITGFGKDVTQDFVSRIEELYLSQEKDDKVRLAAHFYVRYLGDLFGGQIISSKVKQAYVADKRADEFKGIQFYTFHFGDLASDQKEMVKKYKDGLNEIVKDNPHWTELIIDETSLSFELNEEILKQI